MEQETVANKIYKLAQMTSMWRIPITLRLSEHLHISYPLGMSIRTSPAIGVSQQFIGFHDCMVLTFIRPVTCSRLDQIARFLPQIPLFGYITWVGNVKHKCRKTMKDKGKVTKSVIHLTTWKQFRSPSPSGTATLNTYGFIHNVSADYHYEGGKVPYNFMVMEIPAFTRESMGINNINFTWNEAGN